jgi:autonomous glycyl radical cofactor GrcA
LIVRRRIRKRVFLLLASWILLLAAVLSALSLLKETLNEHPDSNTVVSLGWAGYIVSSSFNEKREVIGVSASWTVPRVNAAAGDGYSSAWVGIGGQLDKTLIQIGTEHNAFGGQESYYAWYEMLPDYAIRIENFSPSPGHKIAASITLADSETNEWNLQLTDLSNGDVFNQNFVYNSTRSSGEWIVERSMVNGQITSLSDFGSITFSDCQVDVSSDKGVIGTFTHSRVHMTNHQYTTLASASTLNSGGEGFTVRYATRN